MELLRILVTSILDLKRVGHNRLHSLLKHLSVNHQVTALCLNAWWLDRSSNTKTGYDTDPYFAELARRVHVEYLYKGKVSPVLQELFSVKEAGTKWRSLQGRCFDVHLNYCNLLAGCAISQRARRAGVPTVFDVADDLPAAFRVSPQVPPYLRWAAGVFSEVLLRANVNIAERVTFITRALQSKYALPAGKSTLLPNGFDTELFKECPVEEARRELGIALDAYVVGFVGTLGEWVDLGPVYAAIRELTQAIPAIQLLIVGGGSELNRNRDLAVQYGIADHVVFTGHVDHEQVPRYISCMDICTIPFKNYALSSNSCPIKLFEYMGCGRPVISSPLTGVMEAVQGRVLYAASEDWSRRISELYEEPMLRARMGTEGREFVAKHYSWSAICRRFETVLQEVASRARGQERRRCVSA